MSYILGMDIGVFIAWILTILAAVLCVLYGIYCYVKKSDLKIPNKKKQKNKKEAS